MILKDGKLTINGVEINTPYCMTAEPYKRIGAALVRLSLVTDLENIQEYFEEEVERTVRDSKYLLTQEQVERIRQILEKGDRVELIPGKERIKIIQESRKEIK